MSSPSGTGRLPREAPKVGDYRRGSRLRTTPAGTWFPAIGPDDEAAGLLLVYPGVDPQVLVPTLRRLAELNLPGVLPARPELIEQAGRSWLVSAAPPVPALSELPADGPYATPANAAAVLADLADTLLAAHQAGVAHTAVDARSVLLATDGTAALTDWGTRAKADTEAAADPASIDLAPEHLLAEDRAGWARLADRLAEQWCADDPEAAAILVEAAQEATEPTGLTGGLDALRELAATADRDTLAEIARERLAVAVSGLAPGRVPTSPSAAPSPAQAPSAKPDSWDAMFNTVPVAPPPTEPSAPAPAAESSPSEPAPQPARPKPRPARPTPEPPPLDPAPVVTTSVPTSGVPNAAWPDDPTEPSTRTIRKTGKARAPRWQLIVLAALAVVTLLAAAVDLLIVTSWHSGSDLKIESVVLWAQRNGSTCTLLGVINTNGEAGSVTYGWTGDISAGPAITTHVTGDQKQIEVTQVWTPGNTHTLDPLVTLQVLRPELRQASAQPGLACAER